MRVALCVIVVSAVAAVGDGVASPYVGADACATCHAEIAAGWRQTAHARALASLSAAEAASPRCRACHATGDAPLADAPLDGVQCEACHGAGLDYAPDDVMRDPALARALGLRDLSTSARRAAACMRCHRL